MVFADEKVKPALQKIDGVGGINIVGYKDREIRIYPNINLLNKFGITVLELNDIVSKENVKIGGGKLITNTKEYVLKTQADALTVDELKELVVKEGCEVKRCRHCCRWNERCKKLCFI